MTLVKPSTFYRTAYLEMLEEWQATGDQFTPGALSEDTGDFRLMVRRFSDYEKGIGLREGYVPSTTLWLVRNDGKLLGAVNIRHSLTDFLLNIGGHIGYGIRHSERNKGYATRMLSMTLPEARKLGIDRALITCSKDNIASEKVILKNNGIFESETLFNDTVIRRFWIDIT